MNLKIKKLYDDTRFPEKIHNNDAGYDCFIHNIKHVYRDRESNIKNFIRNSVYVQPLERLLCGLGFSAEIENGYYAQIVPRSGLSLKKGVSIVNSPATIDSGYRGEWCVILINISNIPIEIEIGMKICQFIIRKLPNVNIEIVEKLSNSERNKCGFGSTDEN